MIESEQIVLMTGPAGAIAACCAPDLRGPAEDFVCSTAGNASRTRRESNALSVDSSRRAEVPNEQRGVQRGAGFAVVEIDVENPLDTGKSLVEQWTAHVESDTRKFSPDVQLAKRWPSHFEPLR